MSLRHLLSRHWFERLWIRQEIFLANPKAIVQCGSQQMLRANFWAELSYLYAQEQGTSLGFYDKMMHLNGILIQQTNVPMSNLREIFGRSKCQDARDRVYAVSATVNDRESRARLQPDYNLPVREVYHDAVLGFVNAWESLEVLRECELSIGTSDPSPTWATD
jgi:hypothetical protein